MRNKQRVDLNLATHPSRNRNLFYCLVGLLGVLFLGLSLIGGFIYFSYKGKAGRLDASISEMDQSISQLQSEEMEYNQNIKKATQQYKENVDSINNLIFRKDFSWIDFLSCLEDSLPDSSYIVSLAPTLTEELKVKVRFQVLSQNLKDLLELINNLESLKFKDIRVLREIRNEQGSLRSEISLTYERNI